MDIRDVLERAGDGPLSSTSQSESSEGERDERECVMESENQLDDIKRKRRTQPSRGDAVLIGLLGGLNNLDIAARAGEEPL